eukprot:10207716-Prorocentrum_lima.AAC.1
MPGFPHGGVVQRGLDARPPVKVVPKGWWYLKWAVAFGVAVEAMSTGGMSQEATLPMGGVVEQ